MRNILFLLLWPMLSMAQIQTIPTGTGANTGTGIPLRNAFQIINGNFTLQNTQYAQTAAEIAAGVTPANYGYPSGNALRYGCDPTGNADSSLCFQSAGAITHVAGGGGGGTVTIPCGTYKVSNVIWPYGQVFLKGAGSNCVSIYNNSTNHPVFTFGDGVTTYFHGGMSDIYFGGASGVTGVSGQAAFLIQKIGQFNITNVQIGSFPTALYNGAILNTASQYWVEWLQVNGCLSDGITIKNSTDHYISNSRSDGNGGSGWVLDTSQGPGFVNDTAFNNSNYGWLLASSAPNTTTNSNLNFVNVIGDTSGNDNLHITDCKNCFFVNVWGSSQKSTGTNTSAAGIYIGTQNSKNILFTGGAVLNNNGDGVEIDGTTSSPANISFTNIMYGSTINGLNGNGKSGSGYGLETIGTVLNIMVTGGLTQGNASGATHTSVGTSGFTCTASLMLGGC